MSGPWHNLANGMKAARQTCMYYIHKYFCLVYRKCNDCLLFPTFSFHFLLFPADGLLEWNVLFILSWNGVKWINDQLIACLNIKALTFMHAGNLWSADRVMHPTLDDFCELFGQLRQCKRGNLSTDCPHIILMTILCPLRHSMQNNLGRKQV